MKILFCNIAYMKDYIGNLTDDQPRHGGEFVKKNKDAHEKWNFLNYDGACYGFVQNPSEHFKIERIHEAGEYKDKLEDVVVVWCALNDNGETVVVGWYEHATVHRQYLYSICTPCTGFDRCYFTSAKAEDCYLMPEDKRTFTIGRAAIQGRGCGFGRQNFWYAESVYARQELIPAFEQYMTDNRDYRINRIDACFDLPSNYKTPLNEQEIEELSLYYNSGEDYEALPYAYRQFQMEPNGNNAYYVADALKNLFQFEKAMNWYLKTIEIEGKKWENSCMLPYLYQQVQEYEISIQEAKSLLEYAEAKDADVRHELFGIIADGYYYQGKYEEGITWLDRVIAESTDQELIAHTVSVRTSWTNLVV